MGVMRDFFFGPEPENVPAPAPVQARAEDPVLPLPSDPSSAFNIPSRTASSRSVNVGDALSLSMVYRAVSINAVSVLQLSFDTFRNGESIDAPAWIRRPNVDQSRSAFLEQTVVSLASNGNAYWQIERDAQGRVTNLIVLNPLDVEIETNDAGKVLSYQVAGKSFRPNRIQHLSLLRVPGKAKGLGPIQAAQAELRGAIDTRDYAGNWFVNSGVPNGVLKSDQILTPEAAAAAKAGFTAAVSGGVAVLGNGLSYAPVYLSPEDAQFIQNQQFSVTQIARLFGVPSSLMLAQVEGSTMTYQNVEQDWIGYVRFSLMKYLVEIEEAFSSLLPGRTEAKFNVEALLRSDTKTRYEAHKLAIEAGFLTINEVRAIENLPPLSKKDLPQPAPVVVAPPVEDEPAPTPTEDENV